MFLYRAETDYTDLGRAVMQRAKELLHERHLAGQLDPNWQDCLQAAQKDISKQIVKRVKQNGGAKNGKQKNNGAS
jgi:hypothetical protein